MPDLVATDILIRNRANALRALVNADSFGLLFVQPVVLTPATVLSDLTLASFPGYAPINLAGLWMAPVKEQAGKYFVVCPTQTFTCSAASTEVVYGAGIYSSLGLLAAFLARTPIALAPGLDIPVQFTLMDVSRSLIA